MRCKQTNKKKNNNKKQAKIMFFKRNNHLGTKQDNRKSFDDISTYSDNRFISKSKSELHHEIAKQARNLTFLHP